MKLTYCKISKNILKFFYQEGENYGEFYINLYENGEAEVVKKHSDYDETLAHAFANFFVDHYDEKVTEYNTEVETMKYLDALDVMGEYQK